MSSHEITFKYSDGRPTTVCNCVGPQDGEPKCPCMMTDVIRRDGRWIQKERDLGPIISELEKL